MNFFLFYHIMKALTFSTVEAVVKQERENWTNWKPGSQPHLGKGGAPGQGASNSVWLSVRFLLCEKCTMTGRAMLRSCYRVRLGRRPWCSGGKWKPQMFTLTFTSKFSKLFEKFTSPSDLFLGIRECFRKSLLISVFRIVSVIKLSS